MVDIDKFVKKHDYIICFDSDGTVLDAMNVKHNKCHGKAFIEMFNLENKKEEVQKIWNKINLFDRTRGVNRFIALLEIINRLNGSLIDVKDEDVKALENYVNNNSKLSNTSLVKEIEKTNSDFLKECLVWSTNINDKIAALNPVDKPPFVGVKECLEFLKDKVDIAIVSSSNLSAIKEEWDYYGLLDYVSFITSQETGSKKDCINRIKSFGYDNKNILMVGDALPDVDAAKDNDVLYYPILINNETYSWNELKNKYTDILLKGEYNKYQDQLLEMFDQNFDKIG